MYSYNFFSMVLDDLHKEHDFENPFRGLEPFFIKDAAFFFGREEQIKNYSSTIITRNICILHGSTGVGKTSFFEAGIRPMLNKYNYETYRILQRENPYESVKYWIIEDIKNSIQYGIQSYEKIPTFNFEYKEGEFFERIYDEIRYCNRNISDIVLFFDQFEEYFNYRRYKNSLFNSFIMELAYSIYSKKSPIKIVIGIRNDYLFSLDKLISFIPNIFENTFFLENLTSLEARSAIVNPLKKSPFRFKNDLISSIIDDLKDENDSISPPELQIICTELVDYAIHNKKEAIIIEDYELKGRKDGILKRSVSDRLNKLGSLNLDVLINIFDQLHFHGNAKYSRPFEHLKEISKMNDYQLNKLLNDLKSQKYNILTEEIKGDTRWLQLKHDYLINHIFNWINDKRDLLQRRISEKRRRKNTLLVLGLSLILTLLFIISVAKYPFLQKLIGIKTDITVALDYAERGDHYYQIRDPNSALEMYNKSLKEKPTPFALEGRIKTFKMTKDINMDSVDYSYSKYLEFLKDDINKFRLLVYEAADFFNYNNNPDLAYKYYNILLTQGNINFNDLSLSRKNFILKYHYGQLIDKKIKIKNDLRYRFLIEVLSYIGYKYPLIINNTEIKTSKDFIFVLLIKYSFITDKTSFSQLKEIFSFSENPFIGDLVIFPDWPQIIGIYLGEYIDTKYYISMNISLDEVTFEPIKKDQRVSFMSLLENFSRIIQ